MWQGNLQMPSRRIKPSSNRSWDPLPAGFVLDCPTRTHRHLHGRRTRLATDRCSSARRPDHRDQQVGQARSSATPLLSDGDTMGFKSPGQSTHSTNHPRWRRRAQVRERHPEIKVKDINEYLKNQEVSQINTTVNKTYQYKITAPPHTFQIDIFWFKRSETLIPILLLVDILSRKAWAYVLTKSKKEKRAEVSVKTLEDFKNEVGKINGLTGDNEFSSAAIRKFCEDNNIKLDTSVAKEEHISNGNKLGIIESSNHMKRQRVSFYQKYLKYKQKYLSLKQQINQ